MCYLRMTFGFSLYTAPLQVIQVAYFKRGLRNLSGIGADQKGSEVCCLLTLEEDISLVDF